VIGTRGPFPDCRSNGSGASSEKRYAIGTVALATLRQMRSTPELDRKLRQRFIEACASRSDGNADAFGRLLGYTNGGYVREIVRGVKPVREAIIERVHSLEGLEGWFAPLLPPLVARDVAERAPTRTGPAWPFERLSSVQWASLSERERGAIEDVAMAKLREILAERDHRNRTSDPSRKRAS